MDPHWETPGTRPIQVSSETIGGGHPLVLLAGPVAVENERQASSLAERLSEVVKRADVPFICTASFHRSPEGADFTERLEILRRIRQRTSVPVATEVMELDQVGPAAEVADLLQIPGDAARRVDLVVEAARTGKPVNIVKGPRLGTADCLRLVEQATGAGNWNVILTEQGTSFGDGLGLVVDFLTFDAMRESGFPLVFDASRPLLNDDRATGGGARGAFSPSLALASVAVGVDGLFLNVHDDGAGEAGSAASCPLSLLPRLLERAKRIDPTQDAV